MPPLAVQELQGDAIAATPRGTGIYSWYYRPRVFYGTGNESVSAAISQFMNARSSLDAEVIGRYGLRMRGQAELEVLYGSTRVPAEQIINDSVERAGDFIKTFIQSIMTPHFAKPLYIGIAKSLYERVYVDHFLTLCNLWEQSSPVSRYLESHQNAGVQNVLTDLGLTHSFAIEARVRNLAPRDLVVYVCPTGSMLSIQETPGETDTPLLRSLEQVLQLLADPICGRR